MGESGVGNERAATLWWQLGQPPSAAGLTPGQVRQRLFLTSFALLFYELACIRWIPAYVLHLSFFINFVLLASFLGIGLGIMASRRARLWLPPFPVWLLGLVGVVILARFEIHLPNTQVLYYGIADAGWKPAHLLVLPFLFALVAATFVPLARWLGPLLTALPPLQAYAIDIAGSLAGIAGFFVMSYTNQQPVVWFAVVVVAWALTVPPRHAILTSPAWGAALVVIASVGGSSIWSPYYRIQFDGDGTHWVVNVNSVCHQDLFKYPGKEVYYFRPYDVFPNQPYKRVLVLGSGSGSDVNIALHNGAEHVDAVEIDPCIYRIGRQVHPDKPYADQRVKVHINDGRAFLRNCRDKYDLIIFGQTDSLTLTSGFSSLRLESFLMTTEALRSVREHLNPDGLFVFYNYYRTDWLISKFAGMMEEAFEQKPLVTTYGKNAMGAVFMVGPRLARLAPEFDQPYASPPTSPTAGRGLFLPAIGQGRRGAAAGLVHSTDDWPFVYMPRPCVPTIFLFALAAALLIALGMVKLCAPPGALRRFDWHFFFLGAAFMLLETRSLVTFALLFGTTWMVNSLVFFAILSSVLLAVGVNAKLKLSRVEPLYALLLVALALNWLVPMRVLLGLSSPALRYVSASVFTFLPVFLANVVFSRSFRDTDEADVAFASNLLGAMAGGMLEYAALAWGYQALLVPAMAFYVAAFVLWRRSAPEPAVA